MNIKDMMLLKIHDTVKVENGLQAVRVPGGWIYYVQATLESPVTETFVPEPYRIDYGNDLARRYYRRALVSSAIALAAIVAANFFLR